MRGRYFFKMSFCTQWKSIFSTECIEDSASAWSTVDMWIFQCLRFRFIQLFVLSGKSHHSVMPCFTIHDGIHDIAISKEPISLFLDSVSVLRVMEILVFISLQQGMSNLIAM